MTTDMTATKSTARRIVDTAKKVLLFGSTVLSGAIWFSTEIYFNHVKPLTVRPPTYQLALEIRGYAMVVLMICIVILTIWGLSIAWERFSAFVARQYAKTTRVDRAIVASAISLASSIGVIMCLVMLIANLYVSILLLLASGVVCLIMSVAAPIVVLKQLIAIRKGEK